MRSIRALDEISDGKVYDMGDRVKAGTGGCEGCSACCHDVGDLVVLTPFDVYEIKSGLNLSFDQLLVDKIELRENHNIFLPHLKMQQESKRCSFLNKEDRCLIHEHRPNICRLFPLGRVYEENDFKYFLQVGSCTKPNLEEVIVREWIGVKNEQENKAFILEWYRLLKALTFRLKFVGEQHEKDAINQYLMDAFFRMEVKEGESFYTTFERNLPVVKRELGIL